MKCIIISTLIALCYSTPYGQQRIFGEDGTVVVGGNVAFPRVGQVYQGVGPYYQGVGTYYQGRGIGYGIQGKVYGPTYVQKFLRGIAGYPYQYQSGVYGQGVYGVNYPRTHYGSYVSPVVQNILQRYAIQNPQVQGVLQKIFGYQGYQPYQTSYPSYRIRQYVNPFQASAYPSKGFNYIGQVGYPVVGKQYPYVPSTVAGIVQGVKEVEYELQQYNQLRQSQQLQQEQHLEHEQLLQQQQQLQQEQQLQQQQVLQQEQYLQQQQQIQREELQAQQTLQQEQLLDQEHQLQQEQQLQQQQQLQQELQLQQEQFAQQQEEEVEQEIGVLSRIQDQIVKAVQQQQYLRPTSHVTRSYGINSYVYPFQRYYPTSAQLVY